MVTQYHNKYRIESTRLRHWNYGAMGSYFVTICTQNREHFFGHVGNGEMHLNDIGLLTETEWLKTISLRPYMNLELGNFVVMPNHFHGIIIIGDNEYNRDGGGDDADVDNGRDAMHGVSTNTSPDPPANHFGPQSKNLASIIRGFKSSVTTHARKMGNAQFQWQPRFHDHIIRDARAFEKIQQYIANNPINWKDDKFYC
jgi:putative transposase